MQYMSKENWINEKCKEIEQQRKHAPQTMYRNIEEITGKRTFLSTVCLKTMNGDIIIDKEKTLERWAEYIRELFKDDRKDHNVMNLQAPYHEGRSRNSYKEDETWKSNRPRQHFGRTNRGP
ncbi:hypothetical protein PoB_001398200 [Plakobranchus ocellatus]|uniref:Uncharacterized protein n=1 Tax=Plakobranchus ocellatus TaxID=259542 RepID=A0AAV3YYS1_9GAST|nr:hypothetical protein PoB_001398200 [Plakobranchus ocellatus]